VLVHTTAAVASHPLVGLTILVALWMDDFDANTALSKLNPTSVFAAVATVLLVDPARSLVAAYSNLTAAGNKHGDQEGILRGLGEGIGDCPGGLYCGALGQCVPLRVYLLHAVYDQPAKRAQCGLKGAMANTMHALGIALVLSPCRNPFRPVPHAVTSSLTPTMIHPRARTVMHGHSPP
jgi:hypothetical protein